MFNVIIKNSKGDVLSTVECPVDVCAIGKSRSNLIQLRGWKVAPQHAEIHRTSEGLFVDCVAQRASVEVNGNAIEHYGPLHTSDQIHIAGYILQVGEMRKRSSDTKIKSGATVVKALEGDNDDDDDEMLKTIIGVPRHAEIQGSEELSNTILELRHKDKFKWRNRVHEELLAAMDLRRTDVTSMSEEDLRKHVQGLIKDIITELDARLPPDVDRKRLAKQVLDEAVGLGPLEDLIADDSVTEIMVNKYDDIYVERDGKLTKSEVTFSSDDAVMSAIERIVSPLGRRIDESSPMVDARLRDGSRVNAIIPPLALRGPCLTIRKFAKKKLTSDDLLGFGAISEPMVKFLKVAVEQRCNIVISGGTGSGKTTLLNVLSNFIPPDERIVTVEDAAELKLVQPHLVSLEARPANLEGKGAVHIRDLVKNCLRMRPDRIVVGECRGGEALDMLQAMNTGHDGSLTTAHANTPRDLISRLEVMVMMSGMDLPVQAIREQVASAVDIVVQQTRFSDGSRRVINITEITGVEGGTIQMQDIFVYEQTGFNEQGRVVGNFKATGRVPEFYEDLRRRGINVDMSIFQNR
ncbi:MAG: Flp pilus assembly complex ATPase component TadA [Gammaproteobacteria bacterium]|nr:Flp pilus assembly complex ATPase component TadA [Gammaproteobacteria bacterium]MCP5201527.1 Flp pilus assembly complex ATPase component TadA [Gammaproteobacteria bacterium]